MFINIHYFTEPNLSKRPSHFCSQKACLRTKATIPWRQSMTAVSPPVTRKSSSTLRLRNSRGHWPTHQWTLNTQPYWNVLSLANPRQRSCGWQIKPLSRRVSNITLVTMTTRRPWKWPPSRKRTVTLFSRVKRRILPERRAALPNWPYKVYLYDGL